LKGAGTLIGSAAATPGLCERGNPGMAIPVPGRADGGHRRHPRAVRECRAVGARGCVGARDGGRQRRARGRQRGLLASDIARELRTWVTCNSSPVAPLDDERRGDRGGRRASGARTASGAAFLAAIYLQAISEPARPPWARGSLAPAGSHGRAQSDLNTLVDSTIWAQRRWASGIFVPAAGMRRSSELLGLRDWRRRSYLWLSMPDARGGTLPAADLSVAHTQPPAGTNSVTAAGTETGGRVACTRWRLNSLCLDRD